VGGRCPKVNESRDEEAIDHHRAKFWWLFKCKVYSPPFRVMNQQYGHCIRFGGTVFSAFLLDAAMGSAKCTTIFWPYTSKE
jgi:hypothetical protein